MENEIIILKIISLTVFFTSREKPVIQANSGFLWGEGEIQSWTLQA
jgi:hypothetical protein